MSVNTMPIHKDRRRFDRHSIDFRVEIISRDRQGRDHKEMTTLGEVSGEGARFFTENAERYFVEQSLEVSIFLPGTSNAASRGKAQPVCVAIKLDAPLFFERYSAR